MRLHTILFYVLLFSLLSCDNSRNISKDNICDQTFQEDKFISSVGITVTRKTVLHCDGAFESSVSYRHRHITEGELGGSDHLSGTWQIEENIPQNVTEAVTKYGLKDGDYSVIKYLTSNGINGYCLYYKGQSRYVLTPIYLNQIPLNKYDDSGSLRIRGGFL